MLASETRVPGNTEGVNDAEKVLVGKVASPIADEATSEEFTFWVPDDRLIEKTQIVHARSTYGKRDVIFHAIVDEVFRRSRRRDVMEEADRFGNDVRVTLPLDSQGLTYAKCKILAAEPPVLAPPREESPVFLSGEREARVAYGMERMAHALPVGLLKNGGEAYAGPAHIDLDYLLGANGAHINVNGVAGVATKSSFLTCVLYNLMRYCEDYSRQQPSALDKPAIVPIVLNVKGYDLMWLDHRNRRYRSDDDAIWKGIGVDHPSPFAGVRFLAPEQMLARAAVPVGRAAERYSWSLADIVERRLFPYLFGDEDRDDENFLGLLQDIETTLTQEVRTGNVGTCGLRSGAPSTFERLLQWIDEQIALQEADRQLRNHHIGTWRKFYRRLRRVVQEGEGLLVRNDDRGQPLVVTSGKTSPPLVIDIQSIRDQSLQRFVVATIFAQVSEARTGTNAVPNLSYLIVLDELNRWAPKGATDPITKLIERVVAEMRSQGIVMFGAQQQASQVSPRVIENCSIRVLGRTGSLELGQQLWSFLSSGAKRRAQNLQPYEKLVYQINFREPMQVRVPFPSWAMRWDEAVLEEEGQRFDEREEWER